MKDVDKFYVFTRKIRGPCTLGAPCSVALVQEAWGPLKPGGPRSLWVPVSLIWPMRWLLHPLVKIIKQIEINIYCLKDSEVASAPLSSIIRLKNW